MRNFVGGADVVIPSVERWNNNTFEARIVSETFEARVESHI